MVPVALSLLVTASLLSLGLALPVSIVQQNDSIGTRHRSTNDKDLTIFDKIVQANKGVPLVLKEGDIRVLTSRSALKCNTCQWPKSNQGVVTIPYVIPSKFSSANRDLIRSAMVEFSTMTCVVFKVRSKEYSYINFQDEEGCWSYIGKGNGEQTINLNQPGCMNYGVIQHELMHSLGFFHEHTRFDRDNYVDVNWQYISPENQKEFVKDKGNTDNFPYDYTSVMHYGSKSFVNTSEQYSLIPKPDPNVNIGQRTGLSSMDVKKINTLYDCSLCRTKLLGSSGSFSSNDATPVNNDDSCLWLLHVPSSLILLRFSKFVCAPAKCNATINVYNGVSKNSTLLATIKGGEPLPMLISSGQFMLVEYITNKTTLSSFSASYSTVFYGGTFTANNGSVLSPNYPFPYPNNAKGTYIIIAPLGYQILLNFTVFDLEETPKCTNDYLIINDGGDINSPRLGIYCGMKTNLVVTSSGSMALLQFSSSSTTRGKGFIISYSFVSKK